MRKLLLRSSPRSCLSRHCLRRSAQELVQDALEKQRSGDLAGAAAEYRQFLKMHPEATAIHSNLGAAFAGLGRFEEAIAEYKIALVQSPASLKPG